MSRGLGKVESFVLEAIADKGGKVPGIGELALKWVYGMDVFRTDRNLGGQEPSRAVYQSICRAVRSLERKGYVISEKKGLGERERLSFGQRGGESWRKDISLVSVDTSDKIVMV